MFNKINNIRDITFLWHKVISTTTGVTKLFKQVSKINLKRSTYIPRKIDQSIVIDWLATPELQHKKVYYKIQYSKIMFDALKTIF